MRRRDERGLTVGPILGVIVIALALIGLFAICNEDGEPDDFGLDGVELVSHEYDDDSDRCYGYECREGGSGNEGEYRDDNRRAGISPGPFDRSPVDFRDNRVVICFPFSRCDAQDDGGEPRAEEPLP